MQLQCVYCGSFKEEHEFSGEHVIPEAIGGVFDTENPFKLSEVCGRCNNIFGLFVDGPFLRNFFTKNDRADAAFRTVKLGPTTVLPLRYLGRQHSLTHGTKLCERWLGPTGDAIYHFHEPYPEKPNWSIAVGPPPGRRDLDKIDHGLVFFFLRSNNPEWLPAILRSLKEQFPTSPVFLGNNVPAIASFFPSVPDNLADLYLAVKADWLKGGYGTLLPYDQHSGERFMAKVALGFGALFLDASFRTSDSAGLLRQYVREAEWKARSQLSLEAVPFFGLDRKVSEALNWPGGHLLLLLPWLDRLFLYASFYGKQETAVVVSAEPEHWTSRISESGRLYVIVPGLRKYVGPKTLSEFLAHRMPGVPFVDQELKTLEEESAPVKLPPFMI